MRHRQCIGHHVKVGTEIKPCIYKPRMAKNGQEPPKARREVRKKFSLPEKSNPKDILNLDFLPLELRQNVVLSHADLW